MFLVQWNRRHTSSRFRKGHIDVSVSSLESDRDHGRSEKGRGAGDDDLRAIGATLEREAMESYADCKNEYTLDARVAVWVWGDCSPSFSSSSLEKDPPKTTDFLRPLMLALRPLPEVLRRKLPIIPQSKVPIPRSCDLGGDAT